jgi:hypothetical protein
LSCCIPESQLYSLAVYFHICDAGHRTRACQISAGVCCAKRRRTSSRKRLGRIPEFGTSYQLAPLHIVVVMCRPRQASHSELAGSSRKTVVGVGMGELTSGKVPFENTISRQVFPHAPSPT